jgi:hypothetical protein
MFLPESIFAKRKAASLRSSSLFLRSRDKLVEPLLTFEVQSHVRQRTPMVFEEFQSTSVSPLIVSTNA